jgi:signal transduction histidine kinase
MEPLRVQAEAKGLSFTIAAPDTLPAVESDPERLRQVLQAVVGNALKFTPRGGVRVEARTASDPGTVEFRVADTGPGIPPATANGSSSRSNSFATHPAPIPPPAAQVWG